VGDELGEGREGVLEDDGADLVGCGLGE
jgi:hypothetical protein